MLRSLVLFCFLIFLASSLQNHTSNFPQQKRSLDLVKSYYYPSDGSYRSVCDYPYEVRRNNSCVLDITNAAATEANKLGNALIIGRDIATIIAWINALLVPNDPGPLCFIALVEMLSSIKYLKLKYSPQTYKLFSAYPANQFEFFPMPVELRNEFEKQVLPEIFEEYSIHSSFLVNFWQQIVIIAIIFLCILFTSLFSAYINRSQALSSYSKAFRDSLRWNFLLMIFITYYDDIVFFSSLEFRTIQINSFLSLLSLIICIIMNIAACLTLIGIISIVYKFKGYGSHTDNRFHEILGLRTKWKNFEVLYAKFKNRRFLAQLFIPLFILRIYLFNLVIGYLFDYPIAQAALISVINFLMFLYMLLVKPVKDQLEMTKYVVQEAFVSAISGCVLIIAVAYAIDTSTTDLNKGLGGLIICLILTFTGLGLGNLTLKVVLQIKKMYTVRKITPQTSTETLPDQTITEEKRGLEVSSRLQGKSLATLDRVQISKLNRSQLTTPHIRDNSSASLETDMSQLSLRPSQLESSNRFSHSSRIEHSDRNLDHGMTLNTNEDNYLENSLQRNLSNSFFLTGNQRRAQQRKEMRSEISTSTFTARSLKARLRGNKSNSIDES